MNKALFPTKISHPCISAHVLLNSNSNSNVDGQESDEESVTDVIAKKLPEIDSSAVKKKT